jgi:hypothetical protein
MAGCGCNKQSGGGSKRCSCKKCRRYSQKGGGFFDGLFGPSKPTTTTPPSTTPLPSTTMTTVAPTPSSSDNLYEQKERLELLKQQTHTLEAEIARAEMSGGGSGGNMMARQNYPGHHGGYGELVTAQDEANIGLFAGPSIATQGIATLQGGKRRTRKNRKTRRMKKSRKYRR